jgi:hypothetical protein
MAKGVRTLVYSVALSILAACWGDKDKNPDVNLEPEIANPELSYGELEWMTIVKTLDEIKADAWISDAEWDSIIAEVDTTTLDPNISYDSDTETFTFIAPNVDTNTAYDATLSIKDSQWNYANQNVVVHFNSIDEDDDAPLVLWNITWADSIAIWQEFSYEVSAEDIDGIESFNASILDVDGNQLVDQPELTITEESWTYTIKWTLNEEWLYTLEVKAVWVDDLEWDNSSEQTTIKDFEVLKDALASANYSNFTVTSDSISWNISCEDVDWLQSCEYGFIVDGSGEVPAYIAFPDTNWWNIELIELEADTTYRVYTRIYSLNNETWNFEYTEESRVYKTEAIENAAPTGIKLNGLDTLSFNENRADWADIATISAIDTDTWDTHTFSKVSWTWDDDNNLLTISWNRLIINYSPDYELPLDANGDNIINVRLMVTDNWWKSYEQTFQLHVNDVNETLPDTEAPVLSSTSQTFTTTVWTALTLEDVTATDNEDPSVIVFQIWTPDFDTKWTYLVTYVWTDDAWNESSIVHTYVVNEVPNTVPTWESFSINAWFSNTAFVDLSSYLSDIDWDAVTATMVWSWVIWWDINISDANITWNVVSMTVDSWFWNWYIDYQVIDWIDTNPTIYRVTVIDLDWN